MIRVLVKIYRGLIAFFRTLKTVAVWTPKLLAYMWNGVSMFFGWCSVMPDGLFILAILLIVIAIILLITKR